MHRQIRAHCAPAGQALVQVLFTDTSLGGDCNSIGCGNRHAPQSSETLGDSSSVSHGLCQTDVVQWGMGTRNGLVESLIRLCDARGGYKAVASEAGVSADNLWQIINATKLPSGQPRGVGARLSRKLDAAFPGWANAAQGSVKESGTAVATTPLAAALESLARAIAAQPRTGRLQLQALLAELANAPDDRAETCRAILALLAPGQAYEYTRTWEECAKDAAAIMGDAPMPISEFVERVDKDQTRYVRMETVPTTRQRAGR